jgi:hypothetical protein
MGRAYEIIDRRMSEWLTAQPVFFVATAPLDSEGHINCSPKGNRHEFAVLDGRKVAYLDQTGSGVETIAHLQENARIVLMFCAFDGPPRIIRLHGKGLVVFPEEAGFADLSASFRNQIGVGVRSIITVDVERVSDSCGYGVPLMPFDGHRPTMDDWAGRKGPAGIRAYWSEKNSRSLDGLPGVPS